jgi:hypothetical protein
MTKMVISIGDFMIICISKEIMMIVNSRRKNMVGVEKRIIRYLIKITLWIGRKYKNLS